MLEKVEYFNRTQAFMTPYFKYRVRKYLNQLHILQASHMHWLCKLTSPLEKVFVDENFGGFVGISINKCCLWHLIQYADSIPLRTWDGRQTVLDL